MKILYFIGKSEEGGAQSVVFELLRGHKERGDAVCVMAQGHGWLAEQAEKLGYAYEENPHMRKTYNPVTLMRAGLRYRKLVHAFSPDVISCHSSFSGIVGRLSVSSKYAKIFTAHGWGFTAGTGFWRGRISRTAERIAASFCNMIICVSDFDRSSALRYGIAPAVKIVTVHNGVDTKELRCSTLPQEKIKIIFPARFAVPKLQTLLVDAYPLLPESVANRIQVMFVGNGAAKNAFVEYVALKKCTGAFTVLSEQKREDLLGLMAESDIAVLLSSWEGLPMVLLEALQIGLPVIASAVGGVPEIVDSTVGRCVPNEPQRVAEAITELVENTALRKNLAAAAAVRGAEYTAKRMYAQTFAIYENVLSARVENL